MAHHGNDDEKIAVGSPLGEKRKRPGAEGLEAEGTMDFDGEDPQGELVGLSEGQESPVTIQVYNCPVDHDGTVIYVKGWTRHDCQKPPVVFVHGLRENVGLYRDATKILVKAGYNVFGFDLRGHGRSGRMLGHIPTFESLVSDLLQVVAWVRFKSERKTPIIIAQGIGALITVHFQRTYPELCRAAVLVAPCFWGHTSKTNEMIIKVLAEMSPMVKMPIRLTPKFLAIYNSSRNKHLGPTLRWGFYGITASFVKEILRAVAMMPEKFQEYRCRSLMLCPCKDDDFEYSEIYKWIENHPHKDMLTVKELTDAGHHVLSGRPEDLKQAMDLILPWLEGLYGSAEK